MIFSFQTILFQQINQIQNLSCSFYNFNFFDGGMFKLTTNQFKKLMTSSKTPWTPFDNHKSKLIIVELHFAKFGKRYIFFPH